jgi:hypothetical protein
MSLRSRVLWDDADGDVADDGERNLELAVMEMNIDCRRFR